VGRVVRKAYRRDDAYSNSHSAMKYLLSR
jgi:hypothetical protein